MNERYLVRCTAATGQALTGIYAASLTATGMVATWTALGVDRDDLLGRQVGLGGQNQAWARPGSLVRGLRARFLRSGAPLSGFALNGKEVREELACRPRAGHQKA